MKRRVILLLIAAAALSNLILPSPFNTIVSLLIVVPTLVYLAADIIRNGNRRKK